MSVLAPVRHDETTEVAALRAGDEEAFLALVERHGPLMLRVARAHVASRAIAEEVVQETWLAVLEGIDRFEERSSLKAWIFRILLNRARSRGAREARVVPLSSLRRPEEEDEPAVDPERFGRPWPGHWTAPPRRADVLPEPSLLARETLGLAREAIDRLPGRQREVILLRDVDGWDAEDVCAALGVSQGNQRVLLHRARATVRATLAPHLEDRAAA